MFTATDKSSPPLVGTLTHLLVKAALPALLVLVLWGAVDLLEIWVITGLVIVIRFLWLIKAITHRDRSRLDVALEAMSLIVVAPCSVLLTLMFTRNIVTFAGHARWPVAISLVAAIAHHFGPRIIKTPLLRGYYHATIAFVLLAVTAGVAHARHPYLLATGPAKRRLLAEKVWSLGHTFEAAGHADILFAFAEDLIAEGRLADATLLFERGLEFDVYNQAARQRLASIAQEQTTPSLLPESPTRQPSKALLTKSSAPSPVPIFPMVPPARFCLVLVPCGTVPDAILDRVAAEVSARIQLPVYRYRETLDLPPPDRSFGLIGNRQWQPSSLWAKFTATLPASGACQYILVSPEDLYIEGTNFVFGARINLHGVVSYKRFATPDRSPADDDLLIDRLAIQVLSTSIKGFGLASRTTDCVTTISRDLDEFDRKAQVPAPEIHRDYLNAIRTLEVQAAGASL